MTLHTLAAMGGIFALLVFWHFVIDWVFQSHDEAMKKSSDASVRAFHCGVYAVGFVPVLSMLQLTPVTAWSCFVLLFVSHFIEDTYYPVMLWAKHIRRAPEFHDGAYASDKEAFMAWISKPLGTILMIAIDQLVHIAFLLPIAYLAV